MNDPTQNSEPNVWLFLGDVAKNELQATLNNMALQGYQVYRMDRIKELGVITYDIVMFNPVLMSTKQMEDMQAAFKKAGIDTSMPGTKPGA